MKTRILLALTFGLALGAASAAAQASGDPDDEPDQDPVDEHERLGEEAGSDYDLDDGAFDEAADQAAASPPAVVPPSGAEVEEFRAGLDSSAGPGYPRGLRPGDYIRSLFDPRDRVSLVAIPRAGEGGAIRRWATGPLRSSSAVGTSNASRSASERIVDLEWRDASSRTARIRPASRPLATGADQRGGTPRHLSRPKEL